MNNPLIVIAGATATGKTDLSIRIAKKFNGEIISADSMQIYKEMNIATAKPTEIEKQSIPHHLMDFLDPSQTFSVAEFVRLARDIITQIYNRNKIPIVCGGTGLYINSLINNIKFEVLPDDSKISAQLECEYNQAGGEKLLRKLREIDPDASAKLHPNDKSRIIRALAVFELTGKTFTQLNRESTAEPSPYSLCFVGINYKDRQKLYDKINTRIDKMMENGLLDEADKIYKMPSSATACQAIGYKELFDYFDGSITLEEALDNLKKQTRHYAKRQLTWFNADPRIKWIFRDRHDSDTIEQIASDYILKSGILDK